MSLDLVERGSDLAWGNFIQAEGMIAAGIIVHIEDLVSRLGKSLICPSKGAGAICYEVPGSSRDGVGRGLWDRRVCFLGMAERSERPVRREMAGTRWSWD